jgi:hypothetical protein
MKDLPIMGSTPYGATPRKYTQDRLHLHLDGSGNIECNPSTGEWRVSRGRTCWRWKGYEAMRERRWEEREWEKTYSDLELATSP